MGCFFQIRLLDVDWSKRLLDATMLPPLVKAGRTKRRRAMLSSSSSSAICSVGGTVRAVVRLLKPEYAVCTLFDGEADDEEKASDNAMEEGENSGCGTLALLQVTLPRCERV